MSTTQDTQTPKDDFKSGMDAYLMDKQPGGVNLFNKEKAQTPQQPQWREALADYRYLRAALQVISRFVTGENPAVAAAQAQDALDQTLSGDGASALFTAQQQRIQALEAALRKTDGKMVELVVVVSTATAVRFISDAAHIHDENAALLSPSEAK